MCAKEKDILIECIGNHWDCLVGILHTKFLYHRHVYVWVWAWHMYMCECEHGICALGRGEGRCTCGGWQLVPLISRWLNVGKFLIDNSTYIIMFFLFYVSYFYSHNHIINFFQITVLKLFSMPRREENIENQCSLRVWTLFPEARMTQ